jgi:hypothetical protein
VKPPEPPTSEPADPESYERQVLARTTEVLRQDMDEERELRVLRDVRLEGSYPDTCVVVIYWDPRNPARARERIFRARIWAPASWVSRHGIDPPEQTGLNIAIHALGG